MAQYFSLKGRYVLYEKAHDTCQLLQQQPPSIYPIITTTLHRWGMASHF